MLSWKKIGPFQDDPSDPVNATYYDNSTYYELCAEVGERKYAICSSTDSPEDVCLGLSIGGREILTHDYWISHPARRACGDRIRSVSDATNIAEEWEAAEMWNRHMDLGDSKATAGWRHGQVGWHVLRSEPGTVSFGCITEDGAYRFDCVPQVTWNQILGDMRRAVGHGEDFEPVMRSWLARIEAGLAGDAEL